MIVFTRKKFAERRVWLQIPLFLILFLLCSIPFFGILILPFYYTEIMTPGGFDTLMQGNIVVMLLVQLSTLFGMIMAFRQIDGSFDGPVIRDIRNINFRHFGRGVVISILLMGPAILLLVVFRLVWFHYNAISMVPVSLVFFLLVAIVEEAIFRGFIFNAILRKTSRTSAILISALIFAAVHAPNPNFGWIGMINIFLSGVLLALVYSNSKTLAVPIGIHFGWNFMQACFGFAVSGQAIKGMFVIAYDDRYPMLTGGKFGIEGSLILIPIAGIIIYFLAKRKEE